MKGLALSEHLFKTHIQAAFQEQFPTLYTQLAFGLAGSGSECFGYDDDLSVDHDWGPRLCIWVDEALFVQDGKTLQHRYQQLLKSYSHQGRSLNVDTQAPRDGVLSIQRFYSYYLGLSELPSSWKQWLMLSDESLSQCTNGRVFSDPKGLFTHYRETLLSYYPDDVWFKKIGAACIRISQYGQYNYPRAVKRNDMLAAGHCISAFCSEVVALACLLKRTYKPFYKWHYRKLGELGDFGTLLHEKLLLLVSLAPTLNEARSSLIEEIVAILRNQLLKLEKFEELQGCAAALNQSNFLQEYGFMVNSLIQNQQLRALTGYIP